MKKTHLILDPEATAISDAHAMEFAENNLGGEIRIANSILFDAYRVLRSEGRIDRLTVTFQNGDLVEVTANGKVNSWAADSITDAPLNMLSRLARYHRNKKT